MNENYQQPAPAINDWLARSVSELRSAGITSASLDAEIILAHTLRKNRPYLHAHGDQIINARTEEIADARLALRLDRVPIAYIIGHKEFYGRHFKVTTATLIPRPESEAIIDVLNDIVPKNQPLLPDQILRLVDIGTGSGILGITAKLEHPELDVTLVDISVPALNVAENNAQLLHAIVQTVKSDLLTSYPFTPDIILANLPYVDSSWERSLETDKEPEIALFAGDGGLAVINKLVVQAGARLAPAGTLILEADPTQHHAIIALARRYKLQKTHLQDYCIAFEKSD